MPSTPGYIGCLRLLMSQTDRQTDRQSIPQDYLSIRVTCPKVDHRRVLEKIFSEVDYVCYPHKGKKTGKEHFHLFCPQVSKKNMLRERLRSAGYEGNGQVCIKIMHNGLDHGIQYGSKEGTDPYIQGDLQEIVKMSPQWEDGKSQTDIRQYQDRRSKTERFWMLTRSNLALQASRYQREHCPKITSLREVLRKMMKDTLWRPDVTLMRLFKDRFAEGWPIMFQGEFEHLIGVREEAPIESWWPDTI